MFVISPIIARHLACTDIRTCEVPAGLYSETFEAQVESIPQAVFKSPADYVAVAMKANECKLGHRDIFNQVKVKVT